MVITIVGLGPGNSDLLTRQAWRLLSQAGEVHLRTSQHPTVAGLPAGLVVRSFDSVYQESGDFAAVYRSIVDRVMVLGQRPEGVVYGVPGHPLVGEATVTALLKEAPAAGLTVKIVDGLSFIEPVLTALQIEGMTGLQVVDALDVALSLHPPLNPDAPALLGQLYSRELAGDVKLTLMGEYPEDHRVYLVHGAGTAEEHVESVPLHALDHTRRTAHLTSLYIPALPQTSGLARFHDTVARLRGPGGCPWDQEQTHQSLAQGLVEETAEVLDALDADDMPALCEELGDLLLHIVMQTQIATEDGDFTMADVIAGIEAKIRRRHPHVFGKEHVAGVEQVLANWEAIKQRERHNQKEQSVFDSLPASLSALSQAEAHSRRAAQAGVDWWALEGGVEKVREKVEGLSSAVDPDQTMAEMGDLLFAIANWARWLGIDAQTALRRGTHRFRERLLLLDRLARDQARGIENLGAEAVQSLWHQSQMDGLTEGE
jgi:tetrapyrrole methylase family protein/MazG family protein